MLIYLAKKMYVAANMEDKIPIKFEHKRRIYTGSLDPVVGAGGNTWYLMINGYYYGRLRLNDRGWFFDGDEFRELATFFGEHIKATHP